MVFSSITFLFFFLPAMLLLYWLAGKRERNLFLLAGSLFFYAWGEGIYVVLMLVSIIMNYYGGRAIQASRVSGHDRAVCVCVVVLNLFLLGFFKYANFVTDNLNVLLSVCKLPLLQLDPVHLPIGISFFTFQALSYIIDVFRKEVRPQENLVDLGLYIALFPQLIAGPIVRYHDIARELVGRKTTIKDLAEGIQRFLYGLAKKVLLANPLAAVADQIFSLPETELSAPLAWLGALCFTLQIYYDFSGYSDMAIGLGRMFGFHFLENFNYPYISKSIREFWRRWHISLSSWLRDYLYIPLGGNRRGPLRTHVNLLIVFFLCGFWHGAGWTFVIWGLFHGFFLIIERTGIGRMRQRLWEPLQIVLTLVIVMIGWVIFRCETLSAATVYLGALFGLGRELAATAPLSYYFTAKTCTEIAMALIFAVPVYPAVLRLRAKILAEAQGSAQSVSALFCQTIQLSVIAVLVYFSLISLAAGVYNPFIYYRF